MADREQARDAIDRRAEVVAVAFVGGAGVKRHAHAESVDRREVFACQRALRVERRGDCSGAAKAAQNASPIVLKTYPPCASIAARISASWRASAASIASRLRSQRCVLPSISVKQKRDRAGRARRGRRTRVELGRHARAFRARGVPSAEHLRQRLPKPFKRYKMAAARLGTARDKSASW